MLDRINWFQILVGYSITSSKHTLKYVYVGVIRSRPSTYSKITIQHSNLNRTNIIQDQKYKCKYNITLISFYILYK